LLDEKDMLEINAKLSGIILKKAELENNFVSVYTKVFKKIDELEILEGEEFLMVLGEIGG